MLQFLSNLLYLVYEVLFISAVYCLSSTICSHFLLLSIFSLPFYLPMPFSPLRFFSHLVTLKVLVHFLLKLPAMSQADCPRSSRKSCHTPAHHSSVGPYGSVVAPGWPGRATPCLLSLGAQTTSPSSLSPGGLQLLLPPTPLTLPPLGCLLEPPTGLDLPFVLHA